MVHELDSSQKTMDFVGVCATMPLSEPGMAALARTRASAWLAHTRRHSQRPLRARHSLEGLVDMCACTNTGTTIYMRSQASLGGYCSRQAHLQSAGPQICTQMAVATVDTLARGTVRTPTTNLPAVARRASSDCVAGGRDGATEENTKCAKHEFVAEKGPRFAVERRLAWRTMGISTQMHACCERIHHGGGWAWLVRT